jgi:hypothetical protein
LRRWNIDCSELAGRLFNSFSAQIFDEVASVEQLILIMRVLAGVVREE